MLFVSVPLLAVAQQATSGLNLKIVVIGEPSGALPRFDALLAAEKAGAQPAQTSPDEVAFWLYSSGSTGMPKGVRHVHASAMETAKLYAQGVMGIREDDVVFSAAKLFFAYGLGNGMSFPMSVGATAVLLPDRPTPQAVFAVLKREQPTIFYGVPTLYAAMLADPACTPENSSARLRMCVSAGEGLPEHIGLEWKKRFGVDIYDGVGSTEMLHIFLGNYPGKIRYGTSGVPIPGYEARLIDDNGREVAEGEIGELVRARHYGGGRLLEPAREIAPHLRGRMDAHRRQIRARAGRLLSHLRAHRRHVQGERALGLAVRGRVGADHASARARMRDRAEGGFRRAAEAEGVHRAQGRGSASPAKPSCRST